LTYLIFPYIQRANIDAGWNFDVNYCEGMQFTIYKNNGFYGWHNDGGSDKHYAYKGNSQYIDSKTKDTFHIGDYTPDINMVGKVRKLSIFSELKEGKFFFLTSITLSKQIPDNILLLPLF